MHRASTSCKLVRNLQGRIDAAPTKGKWTEGATSFFSEYALSLNPPAADFRVPTRQFSAERASHEDHKAKMTAARVLYRALRNRSIGNEWKKRKRNSTIFTALFSGQTKIGVRIDEFASHCGARCHVIHFWHQTRPFRSNPAPCYPIRSHGTRCHRQLGLTQLTNQNTGNQVA